MKKMVLVCSVTMLSFGSFSQTETNSTVVTIENSNDELFKSIKPADESPVVFATQADMDAAINEKIENIKQQLLANRENSGKVIYWKEELWRFENAIVK